MDFDQFVTEWKVPNISSLEQPLEQQQIVPRIVSALRRGQQDTDIKFHYLDPYGNDRRNLDIQIVYGPQDHLHKGWIGSNVLKLFADNIKETDWTKEHITDIITHELTHAVDPKLTRIKDGKREHFPGRELEVPYHLRSHEIDAFIQPILRTVRHDKDKAAQLVRLDDRQFLEYISKLVYLKAFKDLHPNNVLKQWIGQPDILKKLRLNIVQELGLI
jgi:hypothetical protein